ncbi:MAG: hypothetical protein FJ303_17090 [Planctomycetes bacterium]|nr:hypothetical protein [Planctomycetota bacterium]
MASLVKKLDSAKGVNSFVVFLSDDENIKDAALKFAQKNGIKKTVLAIDNPAGPQAYKISKDAEVTVLLYTGGVVKANHAYRKNDFNPKAVEAIVKDLPTIQK